MNMSYCRFENTFRDLEDCVDAIVNDEDISEREANFAHRMRNLCEEYIQAYDEWEELQEYNEED